MGRTPIPCWSYAVVVVQRGDQFVLIQERTFRQTWYFPSGRVEPGETWTDAAIREAQEEAGILIRLTGVVRIEHRAWAQGLRVRVIFTAEPADGEPRLKTVADANSLGAIWATRADLDRYPLRNPEVRAILDHLAEGGPVFPLQLLDTASSAPIVDGPEEL